MEIDKGRLMTYWPEKHMRFTFDLDRDMHYKLKKLCLEKKVPMRTAVIELIKAFVEENEKKSD